tara:strand:- start:69 stop:1190 length:1122 start_codon:yes stop_codon:yes gene_type:complete
MEMKVRLLDGIEEKGVAQVEQELIEKHEQQFSDVKVPGQDAPVVDTIVIETPVAETPVVSTNNELSEEQVLSYIGKRYNKQINSLDELAAQREEAEALPEDVAAYMKYKKETGRGFEDFLSLKKDFDSMDSESLLEQYLSATQEGLDADDIDSLMDDYRYDEDIDDESHIKRVKIATKKAVAEAKKFFNNQKEQYKVPLESSVPLVSDEEKETYESYKQYTKQAKTFEEENERKRNWFNQKTDEVFNGEFKGFEFNVNDKRITFNPGDANELKKAQATPANFINKFLDEQGLVKDAAGYHRSLAVAMNPEKFARFFYEQGQSDATEGTMKNIKNIQMSTNRAPEITKSTEGMQVKAINPDSGRSLKIRSIKRV